MSRGRPQRPIGVPGRVNRREIAPGVWEAIVSVRDASGRPRKLQRISPPKFDTRGRAIPDGGGNRAAEAVQVAARELASSPMDNTITLSTTIVELWTTHYRPYLVKKGRAQRTLDSYDREAERFIKRFGSRRLSEVPTTFLEAYLSDLAEHHGPGSAKACRSALSGMFRYAIRISSGAVSVNPLREVELDKDVEPKGRTGGAAHIGAEDVRFILEAVRRSAAPCPRILSAAERQKPPKSYTPPTVAEYCESADMADYVDLLYGLNLRTSQVLGVVWPDFDLVNRVFVPSGKITRIKGKGLVRITKDDDPKNRFQPISVPEFAIRTLEARKHAIAKRKLAFGAPIAEEFADLVFPSDEWTPRDPTNVATQWRRIRAALGIAEDITAHSFRKAGATFKDDAGLPMRVIADSLGQADILTTQRHYLARGKAHPEAAAVLDRMLEHPAN